MKTIKIFPLGLIFCLMLLGLTAFSQTKDQKAAQIKKMVTDRTYNFLAESATPMGGGLVRLTSIYELTVSKDSLNSYLPYFGVAYRVNMGDTGSPLIFTSTDFGYEMTETKRGGYNITIKMNKPSDPNILNLSVSSSGYATLQVISINRQQITFNGYITPVKERKRK